jgi:hypothetical protein
MCVRCGTGRIAWCTDPYRHGESAEPVSPGDPPVVAEAPRPPADASYEAGYRDGESSRTADVLLLFHDACTMDDLLAGFREVTGDPNLRWPEPVADWRDMFAKYARIVEACEGVTLPSRPGFGTPGAEEWTPEEWAAIEAVVSDG